MNQQIMILTAAEAAVFSERAATEGAHVTLPHPPGSALLGWAAAQGRYSNYQDAFSIFHSGKVRFSNALPLTEKGDAAYPVPELLMRKKEDTAGLDKGVRLDFGRLEIGRPVQPPKQDGDRPQREPLRKFFVTSGGEIWKPEIGSRLRTATELGSASTGRLFGYSHLQPGAAARKQRYAFSIEADGLSDEDWAACCRPSRARPCGLAARPALPMAAPMNACAQTRRRSNCGPAGRMSRS